MDERMHVARLKMIKEQAELALNDLHARQFDRVIESLEDIALWSTTGAERLKKEVHPLLYK